jgi:hypothetical protein
MAIQSRQRTGPVAGGHGAPHVPDFSGVFNGILPHATGRLEVTAQTLVHAAYLRSKGLIPGIMVEARGARFQDFRPEPGSGLVRAHRALFALHVGGRNVADIANNPFRPALHKLLIAPQAATDPLPPFANYGDRLMEIVATPPVLARINNVLRLQRPHQKLELHALQDELAMLRPDFVKLYDAAIGKSEDILKRRGFEQVDITKMLRQTPPTSAIVEDDIEFTLHKAGPSGFTDAPQIYLAGCQDVSRMWHGVSGADVEKTCVAMDAALVTSS